MMTDTPTDSLGCPLYARLVGTSEQAIADKCPHRVPPQDDAKDRLRERLAALAHEQWSGWMKYMFGKCVNFVELDSGSLLIPQWAVTRWMRQMNTQYDELPEEEKDSDRAEADKVIAALDKEE